MGADTDLVVRALHGYLTLTPARLLCVALTDAIGDRRTQNQPGTHRERGHRDPPGTSTSRVTD